MKDFNDISAWNQKPEKYYRFLMKDKGVDKKNLKLETGLKIDTLSLYALIDGVLGKKPDGIFTSMIEGMPIDHMIWWDFFLESEIGFIHIFRTNTHLEAQYLVDDPTFDLVTFINLNIESYKTTITKTIKGYEKHNTYINHYQSYSAVSQYLWKEISKIKASELPEKINHIATTTEQEHFRKELSKFTKDSVKLHALGKSLILNSAFMVEAYLVLLIRLGATPNIRSQKELLRLHLNSNFKTKLKNLKILSAVVSAEVDISNDAVRAAIDLMELRNKYVHSDESSQHNNLGPIYFDNNYPLPTSSGQNFLIDGIVSTYHNPSREKIAWSYNAAREFITYLESLIKEDIKEELSVAMRQNPIGFNTAKNVYSIIYPQERATFFAISDD